MRDTRRYSIAQIDANSDGAVSWGEFTAFMMHGEENGLSSGRGDADGFGGCAAHWLETRSLTNHHTRKHTFAGIFLVPNLMEVSSCSSGA